MDSIIAPQTDENQAPNALAAAVTADRSISPAPEVSSLKLHSALLHEIRETEHEIKLPNTGQLRPALLALGGVLWAWAAAGLAAASGLVLRLPHTLAVPGSVATALFPPGSIAHDYPLLFTLSASIAIASGASLLAAVLPPPPPSLSAIIARWARRAYRAMGVIGSAGIGASLLQEALLDDAIAGRILFAWLRPDPTRDHAYPFHPLSLGTEASSLFRECSHRRRLLVCACTGTQRGVRC